MSKRGIVTIGEIWFAESRESGLAAAEQHSTDIAYFCEARSRISLGSAPFVNGIIELGQPDDILLASFEKGFRNEARRAVKEGVSASFERPSSVATSDQWYRDYLAFTVSKKLAAISLRALKSYASGCHLVLGTSHLGGRALRTHVYLQGEQEMLLLASYPAAGEPRPAANVLGWSNRYLHVAAMRFAQDNKIVRYNLGGMGNGAGFNVDVMKFKNEMRPRPTTYYNDAVGCSLKGRMYLQLRRMRAAMLRRLRTRAPSTLSEAPGR